MTKPRSSDKNKEQCVINPNWGLIAFLLIVTAIVLYCLDNGIKSNLLHHNLSILHVVLFVVLLFAFGRKYVFRKEGITVYLLGIPVQRIYWYEIREVYLVQQKRLGQSDDRIYVFRTNSPCAGTDVEKMDQFSLYHPFDVLNLMVPKRQTEMCIHVIRKYCDDPDSVIRIVKK